MDFKQMNAMAKMTSPVLSRGPSKPGQFLIQPKDVHFHSMIDPSRDAWIKIYCVGNCPPDMTRDFTKEG